MAHEDGTFTTPEQNGPKRVRYPFITTTAKDKYAKIIERDNVVRTNNYFPTAPDRTTVTNLLTYSEQFDNAAWTKTSATVSANSVANPMDGQVTADSLLEAAASAEHTITQSGTIAASAAPFSVCVKGLNRDWVRLKITDSAATVFTAFFNVSTGVVGTVSAGATAAITQVYSGWYRCVLIPTSPAAGAAVCSIQPSTDGSTVSYLGVVTNGLYLFGAQFENGSSAGAYALTTNATRSISAPPTDQSQNGSGDAYADPFSYLCAEQIPNTWGAGAYLEFTRPYARIPADQINYPSREYVGKPDYTPESTETNPYTSGISAGTARNYLTNETLGSAYYETGVSIYTDGDGIVYNPAKAPTGAIVVGYATAGTFTLTYKTSTTAALNYNDSGTTIAAAINGLADFITDGLTCGVNTYLSINIYGYLAISITGNISTSITMDDTGLTVSTSKHALTDSSGNFQTISLPRHVPITSHGFTAGVDLAMVEGGGSVVPIRTVVYPSSYWGVHDANTLWAVGPAVSGAGTITVAGPAFSSYTPPASATYTGGIRFPRKRLTEKFYLPGVSFGIATEADIPVPADLQNPEDFLAELLTSPAGYEVWRVEGPSLWIGGPIYRVAIEELYFPDLV